MMHKIGFNKYLENIGITEDKYWAYNDEAKDFDPRYQPDEDGFIECVEFEHYSCYDKLFLSMLFPRSLLTLLST